MNRLSFQDSNGELFVFFQEDDNEPVKVNHWFANGEADEEVATIDPKDFITLYETKGVIPKRNVTFITNNRIEFTSNGRRVRRLITDKEAELLHGFIENGFEEAIDSFCYRIV